MAQIPSPPYSATTMDALFDQILKAPPPTLDKIPELVGAALGLLRLALHPCELVAEVVRALRPAHCVRRSQMCTMSTSARCAPD